LHLVFFPRRNVDARDNDTMIRTAGSTLVLFLPALQFKLFHFGIARVLAEHNAFVG
jgi:hypothetical protein